MSVWSNLVQEVNACIGDVYDVEGVAEELYQGVGGIGGNGTNWALGRGGAQDQPS